MTTNEDWALSFKRQDIAQRANMVSCRSSRKGGPLLRVISPREDLIAWLSRCDLNGVWTDEDMRAEGWDPMSLQDAWDQIEAMIEDA